MEVKELLSLLRNPHKITPKDVEGLHKLVKRYPYFQALYALLAKAAYDKDPSSATQAVQTAAVYATDRKHLRALLENTSPFLTLTSEATHTLLTAGKVPKDSKAEKQAYDYRDRYIETLQQREKREIKNPKGLEQRNSIQAFLQKNIANRPQTWKAIPHTNTQIDLTKKSTILYDDLATESLANVFWKQGKRQQALTMYEKLMLKFPAKRTYFIALIKKLRREI